jgi:hypothetical protein
VAAAVEDVEPRLLTALGWPDSSRGRRRCASVTHPIAYVARGSHANYPRPGTFPIPPPKDLLMLSSVYRKLVKDVISPRSPDAPCVGGQPPFFAGPSDVTGFRCYAPMEVKVPGPKSPIVSFPGRWGEREYIRIRAVTWKQGRSPESLYGHSGWTNTIHTALSWYPKNKEALDDCIPAAPAS